MEEIEHTIWQMLGACSAPDKNDRLIIAITALIEAGVNTGPRIIGSAIRNDFKRGHAGAVLKK